ncbi:MAG: peptide-methionine (S)-S-oxide reductase MsrA, partial [Akkermansiaceae bacterium]|nr:peptide-methionine (S)-S-oxide reductase MsrA [Akkermansiaceae bacterium]
NDRGSQYRSAIYTSSPHQAELAVASRDWYQAALNKQNTAAITTEIAADQVFFRAEEYHQQYLARPGSRPYCSAMPSGVLLGDFAGANYKLPSSVWSHYDWSISHCVLRGDNSPISLKA